LRASLIVALIVAQMAAGRPATIAEIARRSRSPRHVLAGGMMFGRYLAEFPSVYVSYYAGLASVAIALVFLYLTASIFVFAAN
jgi:membrane protein